MQPSPQPQQQQLSKALQQRQEPLAASLTDSYDSPDVQKRIHIWYGLMQKMKDAGPAAEEFVYLKHAQPQAMPFNPFDLKVRTVYLGLSSSC